MAYGLQVRDAANNLTFDSATALGSVCLGIIMVGTGGGTWTFPDFPGRQGRWCFCGFGYGASSVSVDSTLGYPRFTFGPNSNSAVGLYALFVF